LGQEDTEQYFTAKRGFIALVVASPLYVTYAFLGDWGRARAAGIAGAMLVGAIMVTWSLRKRRWYLPVLILLGAAHAFLVAYFPWNDASFPGGTLIPVGLADFLVCLGSIKLADRLAKRLTSDGRAGP